MGDVMHRMGGDGQVAARQLVLALCAGLDPLQPLRKRKIDRLMVADLEMQEGMVLDAAPVAAVERVAADEVDAPAMYRPSRFAMTSRMSSAMRSPISEIEVAGEVRPAPFAAAGIHVEGVELVPDVLGQVLAGQPVDGDAVLERRAAFLLQRLALARRERFEEIVMVA